MSPYTLPPPPNLKRFLLATDLRRGSPQIFVHGVGLALAAKGHLHLVHVAQPGQEEEWHPFSMVLDQLLAWGVVPEEDSIAAFEQLGLEVQAQTEVAADPMPSLVRATLEHHPDLVILGTEGRKGIERLAQLSVSEKVARVAHIPTLFLPMGERGIFDLVTGHPRLTRVLVPVGGDQPLQPAVGMVTAILDLLRRHQAEITLLHVGQEWEAELVAPARPNWTWTPMVRQGQLVPTIIDAARELTPDLVVMATRGGHGALRAITGTNTERVLHEVHCPVLSVPV